MVNKISFKDKKKFTELSIVKKIIVVILLVIIFSTMIYVFINFENIFTQKIIYENIYNGNNCTELYKYGKLVGDNCSYMKDNLNNMIY